MAKIKINKIKTNNGDYRYYLAITVRDNKKVSTRNIVSLGLYSNLIKEHPNLDEYLEERKQECIDSGEYDGNVKLSFSYNAEIKEGDVIPYDAGHIFVERIFNDIGFGELLDKIQKKHNFKYPLKDIVLFLLSQRLMTPFSKRKMFINGRDNSLKGLNFSLHHVYRALDVLVENQNDILKWLYEHVPTGVNRNYTVLYFDGTNTYMETEIEEGLKRRGKGKRNEKEPLVSFGLLMDGTGIPLSFCVFPGSGHETKQLIPLEETLLKDFKHTEFIMITDSALSSREIRTFNSRLDRNYITVIPVRKMSQDKLNRYIFDEKKPWKTTNEKYKTPASINKRYNEILDKLDEASEDEANSLHKELSELCSIYLTRRYPVKEDKKPTKMRASKKDVYIEEDYLISYSLSYAIRDKKNRQNLINRAEKMMKNKSGPNKYKAGDPRYYITSVVTNNEGEVADNYNFKLNETLIANQEKLDGYYAVTTSLTEEKDENVIFWMKRRWMIEDTFLIMKDYLGFRPINHSKDDRIKAHFFSVFLTTTFYRYIQYICDNSPYDSLHNMSDEELFDLLRSFQMTMRKSLYFPNFINDQKHRDIQALFNVKLSREVMRRSMVNAEFRKKLKP